MKSDVVEAPPSAASSRPSGARRRSRRCGMRDHLVTGVAPARAAPGSRGCRPCCRRRPTKSRDGGMLELPADPATHRSAPASSLYIGITTAKLGRGVSESCGPVTLPFFYRPDVPEAGVVAHVITLALRQSRGREEHEVRLRGERHEAVGEAGGDVEYAGLVPRKHEPLTGRSGDGWSQLSIATARRARSRPRPSRTSPPAGGRAGAYDPGRWFRTV